MDETCGTCDRWTRGKASWWFNWGVCMDEGLEDHHIHHKDTPICQAERERRQAVQKDYGEKEIGDE